MANEKVEEALEEIVAAAAAEFEPFRPATLRILESLIQEYQQENDRLRRTLYYLADCTLATAQGAFSRKSTSKNEISRQKRLSELCLRIAQRQESSSGQNRHRSIDQLEASLQERAVDALANARERMGS